VKWMSGSTKRQCDRTLGLHRVRSHCRFAPPLIHYMPDSRTYFVPMFLNRQRDGTLGLHQQHHGDLQHRGGTPRVISDCHFRKQLLNIIGNLV
jgi:hypothetical protein